jgi:protein-L-isoaspartate(D-aspartate) O-methyltransferase
MRGRCLIAGAAAVLVSCAAWAANDYAAQRKAMVGRQIKARGVKDPRVLAAMAKVPRHLFVPESQRPYAYEDRPLPIGHDQTISQPYIVALMTEVVRVEPGDKVLEIGTGSGYQAAVLSEITPEVYTIEILPPLAEQARGRLRRLGYVTVKVKTGDGYLGWPEVAPFDAIIVTAAPDHIPHKLVEQLKDGGRMVVPVGGRQVQRLTLVERHGNKLRITSLIPVLFVPMVHGEDLEQQEKQPP